MNGNFFTMQNDIFKCGLSAYEFIVYAYLVMKADRKTGTCYPSAAKIAADCNISISQVRKVTASWKKRDLSQKKCGIGKPQMTKIIRQVTYTI